jgi:hypothetical protein
VATATPATVDPDAADAALSDSDKIRRIEDQLTPDIIA